MKNTKKKRTAIIFTLCATIIGWLIWGNTSIKTTDIQVTDSRLPNGFGGFTVVRVSDLHNAEFGKGRDERYTETGGGVQQNRHIGDKPKFERDLR